MTKLLSLMLKGSIMNIKIFALTLLFALPLGFIVAKGRMSKLWPVKTLVNIYIQIMRGTPLILQLIFVYFAPYYIFGVSYDRFTAVIIAFVINYAAYFAEIYRSGIQSISVGQKEAAMVMGYSRVQIFFRIIFPQMVKRVVPPVTNEVITLVKDTSMAFVLAYAEMFTIAKQIAAAQTTMIPFVVAAVFYYIFNLIVAVVMEKIEKAFAYYK